MGNICNENGQSGEGNGIHLQGLSQLMTIYGNVCYNNYNNGIRLQIEDTVEDDPAAINNMVVGNVAVLHEEDISRPWDKAISIEDPSNSAADNITGQL